MTSFNIGDEKIPIALKLVRVWAHEQSKWVHLFRNEIKKRVVEHFSHVNSSKGYKKLSQKLILFDLQNASNNCALKRS